MVRWPARLYIWATYRLYHELAWIYDLASWLVSLGRWAGWRRLALEYTTGPRILEVGFGTGELLIEMGRRDLAACGLDYSAEMHRVAARKLRRQGLWVPRVRGVTQQMPFVTGCFDSIVSTFPAGYILDPGTLHEVARLLRSPQACTGGKGGRLVVVGLVLETDSRLLRGIMRLVLGMSEEGVLERFERLAVAAGLCITVVAGEGRVLRLPVVVAEKLE